MRWHLQTLRDDVEATYGEEQRNLLAPCLDSVVERKHHARYHFQESERLLREFLAGKTDQVSLFKLVVGNDKEESSNFYECRLQAGANIIGCLQSMHAVADILSHVVYYALNMNNVPAMALATRSVSIHKVLGKIKGSAEYTTLCDLIDSLIGHADYQYLADIVNHSKHRSIVGTSFTVQNHDDERPHGLEFMAFEYEGRPYPKRWVDTFLESEYRRQDQLVLEIGNEINRLVHEEIRNEDAQNEQD